MLVLCCPYFDSLFQALRVWGRRERKRHANSSRFIFVFALSQFSGPDYLGAWNRVLL